MAVSEKMVKKSAIQPIVFTFAAFMVLFLCLIPTKLTPIPPINELEVDFGEKFEFNDKLQADADALLLFFDNMPSVSVLIKDEPILKSGANTERGVAYTNCDRHKYPTIFIKKIFYEKTNRIQLINILKHELTHSWLCRQQLMSGHDERFRQKFRQSGGFGN